LSPSRIIASTNLAVRGDISAPLLTEEVFVIVKKSLDSLFGQPFAFTKVFPPKISDHDAAAAFVVFLRSKRPGQVEVLKSKCVLGLPGTSFDQIKATELVIDVTPILGQDVLAFPFGTLIAHSFRARSSASSASLP
jgi:hypothetical protein